ncbi:MAG TPA: hypothetical protein VNX23_23380 [Bradyrhizobium sp.]|uniref:hypothetical protein n=1 Tax=Bradyrhizobium sp. TaxID=376 RepID=UPI002C9C3439|nr:hypothetical protein [Bradyrhizobium sp.]HXB80315.1 hypothetical protein [Bradyrhizobium sp.]
MRDDVFALGENEPVLIAQRVGQRANLIEQPVMAEFDMGAVLDISVGPVAFSRSAVRLLKSTSNASRTSALFCSGEVRAIAQHSNMQDAQR